MAGFTGDIIPSPDWNPNNDPTAIPYEDDDEDEIIEVDDEEEWD
jgi:hypothetical protein